MIRPHLPRTSYEDILRAQAHPLLYWNNLRSLPRASHIEVRRAHLDTSSPHQDMTEMSMVFRTDWQSRQLLFTGWIMSTPSSYLGTLIVIFLLGVLSEYVHLQQSRLDAYAIKLLLHAHIPASPSDEENVAPSPSHSSQRPMPATAVGEETEVEVEQDAFMAGVEGKHLDGKEGDVSNVIASQWIPGLSSHTVACITRAGREITPYCTASACGASWRSS